MKKYILFIVCAILVCGCKDKATTSTEPTPQTSVAKDAKWDFFILGTWKYEESTPEGKKGTAYPKGIETFYANGEYVNHTMTSHGEKVLIKGTWQLDDKEEYVLWVTQNEVQSASGKKVTGNSRRKYIIQSLDTEKSLNYMTGESFRKAEWLGK